MRKILVLSGGGVRGMSQAVVLKKLEKDYGSLHNFYDLILGSSVGAINASMIASGKITMDRLEHIYPEMIEKIFKKRLFRVPLYDRKEFYKIFIDEIGAIKLKDCLTKLQITSLSICDNRNHFFKSWTKDGEELLMSEVAKSFAAPLYFGTFIDEKHKQVFFDGGTGVANIPIAYGIVEAQLLWPNDEWFFDIIGCGFTDDNVSFDEAKRFKTIRQLGKFFNFDDGGLARSQVRQEQIGAITQLAKSSKKISFRYWDTAIPKKFDKLDGVKFLPEYKKFGEKMATAPLNVMPF